MTTLDEKIEKASVEKALRYPMMRIKDNLKEIREIGEMAQDYIVKLDPEMLRPGRWEPIPQITIDFLTAVFRYLGDRKTTEVSEIYLNVGNIMKVAIEYATTKGADKEGTLNPKITAGSDMDFNVREYDDAMTIDQSEILKADGCEHLPVQFFEDRAIIKEICLELRPKLYQKYGIRISETSWGIIPVSVVAFFRCAKTWLIDHKDDGPCGVEINLGNTCHIGVSKEGDENDIDYFIYITPGQNFKLDHAKNDADTELQ